LFGGSSRSKNEETATVVLLFVLERYEDSRCDDRKRLEKAFTLLYKIEEMKEENREWQRVLAELVGIFSYPFSFVFRQPTRKLASAVAAAGMKEDSHSSRGEWQQRRRRRM
jgi:hypothetical protein